MHLFVVVCKSLVISECTFSSLASQQLLLRVEFAIWHIALPFTVHQILKNFAINDYMCKQL